MKFEKPSMQTIFFVVGVIFLFGMNYAQFDPTKLIFTLSIIFLVFPLTLLGIFASPKIRRSVKKHYWIERECISEEIRKLRNKQEKLDDIDKQIKIDQEILSLREEMRSFRENRFERCILYSLILFTLSIFLTFFDLGGYINTPNQVLLVIIFLWGVYYVFYMVQSIFFSFNVS